MKYYVILNPASGQARASKELGSKIQSAAESLGYDLTVYETKGPGDARMAAANFAAALNGQEARFYAIGGDGTATEVINGIAGRPNIAFGILPMGTGNDTIRNFYDEERGIDKEAFLDPLRQLNGSERTVDLMKYSGVVDGEYVTRFGINMFNNGFDCNVVEEAARLKTKPLIQGSFAYLLAVFTMFLRKKGISLTIITEGEQIYQGNMLLCAIAGGCYCGGGIKGAAKADLTDGKMDVVLVSDATRRQFLHLFPHYAKGDYLGMPAAEKILSYRQLTSLDLAPYGTEEFTFCIDGEISTSTGLHIEVAPKALRFIIPE